MFYFTYYNEDGEDVTKKSYTGSYEGYDVQDFPPVQILFADNILALEGKRQPQSILKAKMNGDGKQHGPFTLEELTEVVNGLGMIFKPSDLLSMDYVRAMDIEIDYEHKKCDPLLKELWTLSILLKDANFINSKNKNCVRTISFGYYRK